MSRHKILATAALLMIAPAFAETPTASDVMTKAEAREHLAACGTEWQQMKKNGAEGSLIWREFSKTCMERAAHAKKTSQKENASPIR